ncbi:MAG: AMP-binding protein [Crocinitomix sp.]|nr:AMP-binding protein [Crocinitomix sp.]
MIDLAFFLKENSSFIYHLREYLEVYGYSEDLDRRLSEFLADEHESLDTWSRISNKMATTSHQIKAYSNINWKEERFWDNIKFIDKSDLRNDYDQFLNSEFDIEKLWVRPTTGSTGEPVDILYSPEFYREVQYLSIHKLIAVAGISQPECESSALCISLHDRVTLEDIVWINIVSPEKLVLRMIFDKNDTASSEKLFRLLDKYQPKVLTLKPNILEAILRHLEQSPSLKLSFFPAIISSGAFLSEELKKAAQEKLNTKIYNAYGLSEFGLIGIECSLQNGLHIYEKDVVLEILIDGKLYNEGIGELVISSAKNMAMPLLRYKTGDIVNLTSEKCSCGRQGLRLMNVYGRILTTILNNKGFAFNSLEFEVLIDLWNLKDFRITHLKHDQILFEVEPLDSISFDEKELMKGLEKYIQSKLKHNLFLEIKILKFSKNLLPCERYISKVKNQ